MPTTSLTHPVAFSHVVVVVVVVVELDGRGIHYHNRGVAGVRGSADVAVAAGKHKRGRVDFYRFRPSQHHTVSLVVCVMKGRFSLLRIPSPLETHKPTVPFPCSLLVGSRPHDLDTVDLTIFPKQFEQMLFCDDGIYVADVDVGGVGIAVVEGTLSWKERIE